jgi:transposase InsO family protein
MGKSRNGRRRRRLVGVTYMLRRGTRAALCSALCRLGLSGKLNTAFVEWVNLTLRQMVAARERRTWSRVQEVPQLLLHLEWWRAYYHFVRPHESLRVQLSQGRARGGNRQRQRYRQRTPAMAAGLACRRWTVRDLLLLPLPPEPIGAA